VQVIDTLESARTYLSKGFLKKSKLLINNNIEYFNKSVSIDIKILGIEPSAILTLRDEYLKLADDKVAAQEIADRTFLIEEFLYNELQAGVISKDQFTLKSEKILFHGHCYQKALSNQTVTENLLSLPENYTVKIIDSGCCGMAGSFGYEKDHYQVSMDIGNLVLFPAVSNADTKTIIAANGTSCRHQIKDGTKRIAQHPVTILKNALLIE